MVNATITHSWMHKNHLSNCSYPYTVRLQKNGIDIWTETISSLPSPNRRTFTTTTDVKHGDIITMKSSRNAFCSANSIPGGSWIKCDQQFKLSPNATYGGLETSENIVDGFLSTNIVEIIMWIGQADTPTYLETLDKLDQWSSAQYVPERYRRTQRGNELNL